MIYKKRVGDRKYVGNKPPELPALKYQSMELFDKPRKQAVCDCCTTTRTIEEFHSKRKMIQIYINAIREKYYQRHY